MISPFCQVRDNRPPAGEGGEGALATSTEQAEAPPPYPPPQAGEGMREMSKRTLEPQAHRVSDANHAVIRHPGG